MGRNRNTLGTRLLACVMSLVLVVGLMPLPAFVEAAGGAAAFQPRTRAAREGNSGYPAERRVGRDRG